MSAKFEIPDFHRTRLMTVARLCAQGKTEAARQIAGTFATHSPSFAVAHEIVDIATHHRETSDSIASEYLKLARQKQQTANS